VRHPSGPWGEHRWDGRPLGERQWGERQWGERPRGPRLFLPILIGLIQVIGTSLAARGQLDARDLDGIGYALLALGPAALLAWRAWPLVSLGGALLATLAYALLDYPKGPFFVAAIVALVGAIRSRYRWAAWVMVVAAYLTYVGFSVSVVMVGGVALRGPSPQDALAVGAWTAVALAVAEAARVRSAHFAEMARARSEAARARSEQSRRQASEERLRIAQELHDVLGHHLSLINMRAGVALHLLDSQATRADGADGAGSDQAREAFTAIKQASAEALREVRAVLATLHPADEAAPRSPAPGLADLDPLVEQAREAGLPVNVHLEGTPNTLPAEVDRAAYRIVQEALTNVRRHAGASASAVVTIAWSDRDVTVRVDNDGPLMSTVDDASRSGAGNGIPGMRERATALGGRLTAGPQPGGGFRVEAVLPLDPADWAARKLADSTGRKVTP